MNEEQQNPEGTQEPAPSTPEQAALEAPAAGGEQAPAAEAGAPAEN